MNEDVQKERDQTMNSEEYHSWAAKQYDKIQEHVIKTHMYKIPMYHSRPDMSHADILLDHIRRMEEVIQEQRQDVTTLRKKMDKLYREHHPLGVGW